MRTPLTSIRAFSEILLDDPDIALAEREKFLGIITRETERLTRLINQVLDLAKIESGRAEWQVTRVDVRKVIAETIAGMSPDVQGEERAARDAAAPTECSPVDADLDRLIQVLLNLLSNALKFCAEGNGRVEVALTEADGVVRVGVRDNGPGIDLADQTVIFDKFRQAGDTLTEQAAGHRAGAAHQPSDRRAFWRPDVGGKPARAGVPASRSPCRSHRPLDEQDDQGGRMADSKRKVLIVDDEPNIVTALEYLLRRSGYDVQVVTNGAQALAQVESYVPDVVLLDIMMPVKSGYEVCQRMRERPEWRHIKIVMLSAKGREAEVSKGMSLGADLYITKPFSTQELIAAINGFFHGDAKPDGG